MTECNSIALIVDKNRIWHHSTQLQAGTHVRSLAVRECGSRRMLSRTVRVCQTAWKSSMMFKLKEVTVEIFSLYSSYCRGHVLSEFECVCVQQFQMISFRCQSHSGWHTYPSHTNKHQNGCNSVSMESHSHLIHRENWLHMFKNFAR